MSGTVESRASFICIVADMKYIRAGHNGGSVVASGWGEIGPMRLISSPRAPPISTDVTFKTISGRLVVKVCYWANASSSTKLGRRSIHFQNSPVPVYSTSVSVEADRTRIGPRVTSCQWV